MMIHTKILTILVIFILCNCKNKEEIKTDLGNYSTFKEIKFQGNTLAYSFYGSTMKDSIEWEEPDTPQIGFAIIGSNGISKIHVRSYNGHLPDSLDFSKVSDLRLQNSILKGNKNILPNDKISFIDIYNSFFYDSVVNLKMFPNLNWVEIVNSKTNFIINDSLPIEQFKYVESDSLYPAREIKIDFDKLPNLKALSFKCKNCKIDIPHDSLNLIYKEDENGIEITKGSYPIIPFLNKTE